MAGYFSGEPTVAR